MIALRRTVHHRLGCALQMCTVRYVGLFLEDPLAVPWPVVEHLAVQLGIEGCVVAGCCCPSSPLPSSLWRGNAENTHYTASGASTVNVTTSTSALKGKPG